MEGEIKKMPTKQLIKEETLPANTLRNLSQKSLMEMVSNYEKLGLIVNNDLSIAMLRWDKYEELVDLITWQNERIGDLESIFEDIQLANRYGSAIEKAEKGESKSYTIDTAEELFNLIEE